jgi:hypothetical protein
MTQFDLKIHLTDDRLSDLANTLRRIADGVESDDLSLCGMAKPGTVFDVSLTQQEEQA